MTAPHRVRPWLAGLLSLLQVGLGHLYARDAARGIALAAGVFLLLVGAAWTPLIRTFPGLVVYLGVALAALVLVAVDAVRRARPREAAAPRWYNRWYVYLLYFCGIAFAVAPLVKVAVPVRAFRIPGGSMAPTLQPGDHLVAERNGFGAEPPRRGDLVVFVSPERHDVLLIKRIVAVGGETVEIRDKVLFVDGRAVADPHAVHRDLVVYPKSVFLAAGRSSRDQLSASEVPEGSLFVLGDNRDDSLDSRHFGSVEITRLLGRPLYIYWSEDLARVGRRLE